MRYTICSILAAFALLAGCAAVPPRASLADLQKQVGDAERGFARSMAERNFAAFQEFFGGFPDLFDLPVQLDGLDTAWLAYPFVVRPDSGLVRSAFQAELERRGVDTRMVWTGNVTRQPMMRGVSYRTDPAGYPNADRVMEHALLLPCNHGMSDADVTFVCDAVTDSLAGC